MLGCLVLVMLGFDPLKGLPQSCPSREYPRAAHTCAYVSVCVLLFSRAGRDRVLPHRRRRDPKGG